VDESRPDELSLQERYAPASTCFGCGPANERGLHVRSFVRPLDSDQPGDEEVVAEWRATVHHEAFPGVLNGGIIGALLDCHSNWAAAHHLMLRAGAATPPTTVTADYAVTLRRPTPTDGPLTLRARVVDGADDRATVASTLEAAGKVCATFSGTFVAVRPGHPAYHRW
jgi:acyl-coenzyme A thioesterase PaaI-like protein